MILTPNEISYLASSFRGNNPLSLFSNIKTPQKGDEYKTLSDKGIIVGNAYEPKALDMLTLLSNPEKSSRLIIQNTFYVVEKYSYRVGNRLVIAENKDGAFVISEPDDLTGLIISISEFVSMSKIKTTEITELFTPDELIALFTVIDICRRNVLAGYIRGNDYELNLTESDIAAELSGGFANGLARSVINNYSLKKPPAAELARLLESLSKKGCITLSPGAQIKLTPVWTVFAKNFLIPDTIILCEMFETDADGSMMAESTLTITAGIHDIVSLTFDRDTFKFETPAAMQLIRAIEATLECPSFEKKPPAAASANPTPPAAASPAAPSTPAGASWQCRCGTVNKGNFCVNCGLRKP